ncbi:MAG: heparinase II/III-family protein, partial [Gemmatimonadota bacterium]|nr:heparinase II/III-family protein [Gemmatimonadota bacterium]
DDPVPGRVHAVPTAHVEPRIIVLRPDEQSAIAVECGPRAGGHGHPDLLNLTLFRGRSVLADFGTGSYVDPSLHWYRSALAHNVPGVAGRGQWPAVGVCDGLGQAGAWSWCRVRADGVLGPDTAAWRSVVVGEAWLLDVVTVDVPDAMVVDLPLHPLVAIPAGGEPIGPAIGSGEGVGHETGYDRLGDVRVLGSFEPLPLDPSDSMVLRLLPRPGETLLGAVAPGPPGADFGTGAPLRFLIRRASGPGRWVQLISWVEGTVSLRARGAAVEVGIAGQITTVEESDAGVTVDVDGARRCAFRARPVAARPPPVQPVRVPADCALPLWPDDAEPFAANLPTAMWDLGEHHYRRSEQAHADRGGTSAEIAVAAQGAAIWIRVTVTKSDLVVRAPDASDPALDNEVAEIHSDGVQAYVGTERWMGVLALPDFDSGRVRVQSVAGTAGFPGDVTGTSRRTERGYELRLRLPADRRWRRGDRLRFTVTVNEMVRGRERRSGQLALAGGGWVWLRGDREAPHDAVEAEIA